MQSIFRLACWDGLGDTQADKLAMQKMRASPIMDMPLLNKLKRKRTDSPEPMRSLGDHDAKRRRHVTSHDFKPLAGGKCDQDLPLTKARDGASDTSQHTRFETSHAREIDDHTMADTVLPDQDGQLGLAQTAREHANEGLPDQLIEDATRLSTLQQAIEHQFNVEILLKHRELRLIDQEIAKCQVALEQLRRCELVPYPGTSELSYEVSSGTGPALRPFPGNSQPRAPAPWGVTDGPYSRHYSKWLLPDPLFDSMPVTPEQSFYEPASARVDGRSTRNSIAGLGRMPTKRSTTRDSISSIAPSALPPPAKTGKQGPLVLRRISDNKFVKLWCVKCERGNFSSVQGFLNHCRIRHKVDYKSHEAAAQECGFPLGDDEAELAATAPPPVGTTVKQPAPKPAPVISVPGTVHPLNTRTPPLPTWKSQAPSWNRMALGQAASADAPTAASSDSANKPLSSPSIPSPAAPHLSALFAKRGLGGDLRALVAKAREMVDIGMEDMEDDEGDSASPDRRATSSTSRSVNGVGHLSGERPPSRKGNGRPMQRPRPAALSSLQHTQPLHPEVPESPRDADLSPHTADSNPGLVSDHDDDPASDPDDDSHPEIAPGHPIDLATRSCGADLDVDVEMEDDHDQPGMLVRPRSMLSGDQDGVQAPGSPSNRPRSRYGDGRR